MKRKVAGVLAAAMAAGMLAGCGSSANRLILQQQRQRTPRQQREAQKQLQQITVTRSLSSSGTAWVLPTEN